jgi:hypothetical protein
MTPKLVYSIRTQSWRLDMGDPVPPSIAPDEKWSTELTQGEIQGIKMKVRNGGKFGGRYKPKLKTRREKAR